MGNLRRIWWCGGGEFGANLDGKKELRARVLAENGYFVEGALTGNKNFGARALAENDYFVEGGLVANFYSVWGALAGNGIVEETLAETECFLAEKGISCRGSGPKRGFFVERVPAENGYPVARDLADTDILLHEPWRRANLF